MTEFVRKSQLPTQPQARQCGTEAFGRHQRMKNRAGSRWRTPVEFPTSYVRDSQLATLEHFAQLGLPPIGIDIDVVRKFWVDHPEHRDYAARTAQPQN